MRRTNVIVDSRNPARHRGELRRIGPALDRAVAQFLARSQTKLEEQAWRRAA